jgi:hypothetical protein
MQESSTLRVHQTHSATRDDDGRGGKRDQIESQEAGENLRATTHTHQLPWHTGASTRGAHVVHSASRLCCTRASSAAQHKG